MKHLAVACLAFVLVVSLAAVLTSTGHATQAQPRPSPSPTVVPIRTPGPEPVTDPNDPCPDLLPVGFGDTIEDTWNKIVNRCFHTSDDIDEAWLRNAPARTTMRELLAEALENAYSHSNDCFAQLDIDQGTPQGEALYQFGMCHCYTSYLEEINATARWLTNTQADLTFRTFRDDVSALVGQFLIDVSRLMNDAGLSDSEGVALDASVSTLYARLKDYAKANERAYLDDLTQFFIEPFRQEILPHQRGACGTSGSTSVTDPSCSSPDADAISPHD